jgi:ribose transport system substrate-binding protein
MKRILVLFLIMALLLVACAQTPTTESQPAAPQEPAEQPAEAQPEGDDDKYVIGVSYEGLTNDWAASLFYHLQYSFDIKHKDKVEQVYYESADGDATKQVNQIENLLTRGVDALMIQPLSELALVNVIERATDMGIPVVVFGSSVLTDKYVTYVDRDNYLAGKNIATWMCEAMGGEGKVVTIVGEPGSGYSENVLRGVNDALSECPGITNVGTEYGEYSAAVTKQKMETLLASNPDIRGVIVDGGLMSVGIFEAYQDAGLPYPYLTGDDWNGFQKKAMELGYTDYISIPGGSEASAVAADLLFDHLAGQEVPKQFLIDPKVMSGAEVQAQIPEGMPDSYWAMSLIPLDYVDQYYK